MSPTSKLLSNAGDGSLTSATSILLSNPGEGSPRQLLRYCFLMLVMVELRQPLRYWLIMVTVSYVIYFEIAF